MTVIRPRDIRLWAESGPTAKPDQDHALAVAIKVAQRRRGWEPFTEDEFIHVTIWSHPYLADLYHLIVNRHVHECEDRTNKKRYHLTDQAIELCYKFSPAQPLTYPGK